VIHQFDPAMAPDTDFVPGALPHLVPGNTGRMLDRRRTPVRVVALKPETGQWVCEVLAFEDQGARWALPFESVTSCQFERGAASATEASLRHIRSAVRKFNREAAVPLNKRNRKPTERRIAKLRSEVAAWLKSESEFIASRGTIDPGSRRGSPLLAGDLEAFMKVRGLNDLEHGFAASMVSNPHAGEIAKGHALVLADLGLASFSGTVIRDPSTLEPPWTIERRRDHILARLAFVREAFSMLGLGPAVLYRAVSSAGRLEPRRPQTFVSATFSFEVAMSLFGPAWEGRSARIERQAVPVERLFMTHLETAAMNRQFHEAEAILLEDPENPAF
jgi:hypothetical protein